MADQRSHILEFAELIRRAKRVLVFTGAGISTGSGIPDFRGPQGLWRKRQPVYYEDFMTSEAARIEHWDFKLECWESFRDAQPNAAHHAVLRLEQAGKLLIVVTQNIDGLHQRAGTSPAKLVEIHGTNLEVECQNCRQRSPPEPHYVSFRRMRRPPRCGCGGFLKPATISFGQPLRPEDMARAEAAAVQADLVIALGSTLSVYPAAAIPLLAAKAGASYVIVNSGPTDHDGLSQVSLRIEGDVTVAFPAAVDMSLAAGGPHGSSLLVTGRRIG